MKTEDYKISKLIYLFYSAKNYCTLLKTKKKKVNINNGRCLLTKEPTAFFMKLNILRNVK